LLQQGEVIAGLHMGFVDPAQIQLRARRNPQIVRSTLDEDKALDLEAQKELFIQLALDKAFILQSSNLRDYVHQALAQDGQVSSRELEATTMQELLNLSHAIEVGAAENLSSRFRFVIEQDSNWLQESPRIQSDNYFTQRDEFMIRLLDNGIPNE
jgi:hypothetical protein